VSEPGQGEGKRRGGCLKHGETNLKVVMRRCNYSAFNGYRYTPSAYSLVECFAPGCNWMTRTKAAYVDQLSNATDADMGIHRSN
jgi:hypothetical protein